MTPKPYISWSQLSTWEWSPEAYRKRYILGEQEAPTPAMEFGRMFAEMLEKGDKPEDPRLQHVLNFIPSYPLREFKFGADCKVDKDNVRLFCVFDGYNPEVPKIGEYKTGKLWTQKKADDHGQVTFYAYAYWLKFKKIPELELAWIETEGTEDGGIQATGKVEIFNTKREMKNLIAMQMRINDAWRGIKKVYEEEINSIA